MIDLKGKNILCKTKEEADAILEEAGRQGIKWGNGTHTAIYNPFSGKPIILYFEDNRVLYDTARDVTDFAKDLLNPKKEMTALEFLNKFIEMSKNNCDFCANCKTITYGSEKFPWCDFDYWTKDNINQVYEIVKSGNKLADSPEQKAIDNFKHFLDKDEELKYESVKLAIEVLEEKLNEKQK